jgi:hypothetical protein
MTAGFAPETVRRGPGRPPKEAAVDGKTASLARAEARLREIRANMPENADVNDRYRAPAAPAGFTYEWKRRTIYNQEDPAYQVELMRQGWEAVPLDRHPEMMPHGWSGNTIEIDGLVLMERPTVLVEECRAREAREARLSVKTKEAQLSNTRPGDLGQREVQRFSKTREPIMIGDEE